MKNAPWQTAPHLYGHDRDVVSASVAIGSGDEEIADLLRMP
jgi:hypothetical protein